LRVLSIFLSSIFLFVPFPKSVFVPCFIAKDGRLMDGAIRERTQCGYRALSTFGDFSNSESWDQSQHSKFLSAATRRRFKIFRMCLHSKGNGRRPEICLADREP